MAVPKKKNTHLKTRNKYTLNHIKNFKNRSISFTEFDIYTKLNINEFVVPYYLMNTINKRIRIKTINN